LQRLIETTPFLRTRDDNVSWLDGSSPFEHAGRNRCCSLLRPLSRSL